MYKRWVSDERRAQIAERRWLESYKPPARISGEYISPIPPQIFAGVGGFKELDNRYREWRRLDNDKPIE